MNASFNTPGKPASIFVKSHPLTMISGQRHDSDSIEHCRNSIHARMPACAQRALSAFMCDVFADDELVQAYVAPVRFPTGKITVMPLDLCERVAARAGQYPGLLHRHERELASVAAFVQSCGYYWCAHDQASGSPTALFAVTSRVHRARIAAACRVFLEEPLRQLRLNCPELGCTLAQVLGMDDDSPYDPHQVARIQAALGGASMRMS